MKSAPGTILRPEQASYLEGLRPPRDPLLAEMEELAKREDIPVSDPEVGRFLGLLARSSRSRKILEIGTAIGYGTLWLSRGAVEARVTSIDPDESRLDSAREYLRRAGVLDRIDLIRGEALQVVPSLEGPWDLVYLDALKNEYRRYLDLVLPAVSMGGLLVVDNLLWKGRVAVPSEEPDSAAAAIRAFNSYFLMHPQLDAQILPLGDGVGLAVKTGVTVMERGGPF